LADPFSVALLDGTLVAAEVVTMGGPGVVNDRTPPNEVPSLFDAMAQK
jgi:hypothetical protein